MRIILLIALASIGLGGCAFMLEAGALEGAEIGAVEAGAGAGVAEGAIAEADIATSADLSANVVEDVSSATRRGELSNALYKMTDGGRTQARWHISRNGVISAAGQPMAQVGTDGEIIGGGRRLGFFSANDSMLYEYADGTTRPIAALKGFVEENGVRLVSRDGGTVMRILRRDVMLDIIGVGDGQYLVRLADGEVGWAPAAAVATLALLAVPQMLAACPPEGHEGAIVRKSGEMVRFKTCKERNGAFIVSDDDSTIILDAYDVETVLTGDSIPGVASDDAGQAVIQNAQMAAQAVGAPAGDAAMMALQQTPYLPALEANPSVFQNASFAAPSRRILPVRQAWAGPPPGALNYQNQGPDRGRGPYAVGPGWNGPRGPGIRPNNWSPGSVGRPRDPRYGYYGGRPVGQPPGRPSMYQGPQNGMRPPGYAGRPIYGGRGPSYGGRGAYYGGRDRNYPRP